MIKKRAEAVISTENLRKNYRTIKNKAGSSQIIAVVKADAYGHGAVEVSHILEEEGCGIFAVASVEEALLLRDGGITEDILILGVTAPEYAETVSKQSFIQTVNSTEYALSLNSEGYPIRAHIKLDTGMSRLGLYCHRTEDVFSAAESVKQIHKLPNLHCEGIFTHFATSDEKDSSMARKQYRLFKAVCDSCMAEGVEVGIRHCCNSAAILFYPEMHLDAVRAGLLLYGLMPDGSESKELFPVMTLISRVSQITKLKKGDTVSYGASFTADKDMTVAAVSIGYADGISRVLSGRFDVTINGKKCRAVGKICMDMCMFDVTDANCSVGDEVEIFGQTVSANKLASDMRSINYELVCSVRGRVPRTYI